MTVIKEFADGSVFAGILLCIGILSIIISLIAFVLRTKYADSDKFDLSKNEKFELSVASIVSAIVGIILVIVSITIDTSGKRYRIRVDNDVTIGELLDTYVVLDYDKNYDVWEVKERIKNE